MTFLTIIKGRVVLQEDDVADVIITNINQFKRQGCYCSSPIDFPEKHTKDPEVIKLCKEIQKRNKRNK